MRRELIERIHKAFGSVALGDGLTIREFVAVDARLVTNHPDLRSIKQPTRWEDIPESYMEFFYTHGILNHCGIASVPFYLPAAMSYVLSKYNGEFKDTCFEVANAADYAIDRVDSHLTPDQRVATNDFRDFLYREYPDVFSNDA